MRLEPRGDKDNPGLWVNPEWQEGTAGTFALIIGVSRYAHLYVGDEVPDGGEPRWVVETRRLGQLKVSALTAHEVFSWLATRYRVEEVPVAKCWLLLSPSDAEHAFRPELRTNAAPPTFEACKRAIGVWYASMARLAQPAAERSRLLFFFSGHGLEVHQNQQVLLPADYLAPPLMSLNDALSTQNLFDGLVSLAVCRQFLFVDACRNDHQELRNKRITGAPLLNVDVAAATNPLRVAPLFFATAAGQRAWEHMHPEKGFSLFGRALLDGLLGTPEIEVKCANGTCEVSVFPLQSYMQGRVAELLKEAGAEVIQPVQMTGVLTSDEGDHGGRSGRPATAGPGAATGARGDAAGSGRPAAGGARSAPGRAPAGGGLAGLAGAWGGTLDRACPRPPSAASASPRPGWIACGCSRWAAAPGSRPLRSWCTGSIATTRPATSASILKSLEMTP